MGTAHLPRPQLIATARSFFPVLAGLPCAGSTPVSSACATASCAALYLVRMDLKSAYHAMAGTFSCFKNFMNWSLEPWWCTNAPITSGSIFFIIGANTREISSKLKYARMRGTQTASSSARWGSIDALYASKADTSGTRSAPGASASAAASTTAMSSRMSPWTISSLGGSAQRRLRSGVKMSSSCAWCACTSALWRDQYDLIASTFHAGRGSPVLAHAARDAASLVISARMVLWMRNHPSDSVG